MQVAVYIIRSFTALYFETMWIIVPMFCDERHINTFKWPQLKQTKQILSSLSDLLQNIYILFWSDIIGKMSNKTLFYGYWFWLLKVQYIFSSD